MKKKNKVLLIIPSYNEEKNILNLKKQIDKYKYDYVFINDCSTDNSINIFEENKLNHVDLVHNLGIGGAVQTGYKYAYNNNYDIAVQFDGDGQHNIDYIEDLIKELDNNDLVIGSRFVKEKSTFKSTKSRRVGIKLISFFTKLVTGNKVYDTTSGFRACNKKLIEYFAFNYPTEYPEPITNTEVLKKGYKVSEIPVEMNERKEGKSSIHSWKNIYYMINVILSIIIVGFRRDK